MPNEPELRRDLRLPLAGVGLVLASLACLWKVWRQGPSAQSHQMLVFVAFLLGLASAIAYLQTGSRWNGFLGPTWRYCLLVLGLTVTIPCLVTWCGMRQFGGFDHSMVIDFGWRLILGQRPFVDFPSTVPISFLIGPYYAFRCFGLQWHSLVVSFAFLSGGTFLWSLFLLGQIFRNRFLALLFATALQALCVVPVSYWWYNPLTSLGAILFALSAYVWLREPRKGWLAFSYGASLFFLATTKPNVAGLLIFPITFSFLSSSSHRLKVILLSGFAFLAFILLFWLNHFSFTAYLEGFRSVAVRGFVPGTFFVYAQKAEVWLSVFSVLLVFLPLFTCTTSGIRRNWRASLIGLVCAFAGLNSFVAAGETKAVDFAIILFGVVICCHGATKFDSPNPTTAGVPKSAATYLIVICIIVSFVGLAVGITRHRVHGIGPGMFFEFGMEKEPLSSGFFKGLYCGPIFKQINAEVSAVVHAAEGKRIFFGPRMQWAYAAFGQPSPTNHPVWWHPDTSFPIKDEPKYIEAFVAAEHDVLVFFKNDTTYYSSQFLEAIRSRYREDQAYSEITVFWRNN